MIGPLLRRTSRRYLTRHPAQTGLAVLGVALGVAVVVSIDLANASARRAFTLSTEAVTGRATHQVVGGPDGVPEAVFRRLVVEAGAVAAPVVEGTVTVPLPGAVAAAAPLRTGGEVPGRTLHLLGVDPFSERPFRPYLAGTGGVAAGVPVDFGVLLTRPGACVLAEETARELGLRPGDRFDVQVSGRLRPLLLAGVLRPADERSRRALSDLVGMDIAAAQELTGRLGRLDRIDLLLGGADSEPGRRELARLAALLPPGVQLVEAASRGRNMEEMTRAFRVNLTALSLLALVCGAFLIYNTMTFSVVQRRTLLGTLRALGVTRGQVLALVLGEALAVGAAGTAIGLGVGVVLGQGLVRLVTQTINDLYFQVAVRGLAVPAATLVKGAAIGLGATLLAALLPAIEATLAPPRAVQSRSALEARVRRMLPRVTAAGVGLLALCAALLAIPGGPGRDLPSLVLPFAGLFAGLLGAAFLTPGSTVLLMRLLRRPIGAIFGVLGRMAAGGVVSSLSRTAVAIAALVVAVSVTVGVGVMIDSFRKTVVRWLEGTLLADVYISPVGRGGGFRGLALPPEAVEGAVGLPDVVRGHLLRRAELPSPLGPIRLIAVGVVDRRGAVPFDDRGPGNFELFAGDPARVWPAFRRGAVVVSEPFARLHGVGIGGVVHLRTAAGDRAFPIAGIVFDYATDRGFVLMSRDVYLRELRDPVISALSLDLAPGADADRAIRRLRQRLAGIPALSFTSNRALKKTSLEIFDRTFLITGVLRLLVGLVAAVGVLSALLALQLERAREIGVLRATGLTPRQVWQLVTAQTGLIGLVAGLLSLPVGLALSAVMVYVVNRRSFGWTVRLEVAPGILVEAMVLALGAALLAGLYPAWRMARTSPAVALREE